MRNRLSQSKDRAKGTAKIAAVKARTPSKDVAIAKVKGVTHLLAKHEERSDIDPMIERVITYLGGPKTIRTKVQTSAEVHDLIVKGLPGETLTYVVSRARFLDHEEVGRALGVSTRTIQRRKEQSHKPLSAEQGDKAWKFSELMVRAASVLGSQESAEKWFDTPAIALEQRRPIDLLGTSVGASVVGELLGRMEHGVYT